MDIFDILGPVMVGPSSSHTAGAARIGKMARTLLGGEPMEARIHLHGSFAETGSGHGTDRALVAGLLVGAIGYVIVYVIIGKKRDRLLAEGKRLRCGHYQNAHS